MIAFIYSLTSVDVESGIDICVDRMVLSEHASFIISSVSDVQSASWQTIQLSIVSLKIEILFLTTESNELTRNCWKRWNCQHECKLMPCRQRINYLASDYQPANCTWHLLLTFWALLYQMHSCQSQKGLEFSNNWNF